MSPLSRVFRPTSMQYWLPGVFARPKIRIEATNHFAKRRWISARVAAELTRVSGGGATLRAMRSANRAA